MHSAVLHICRVVLFLEQFEELMRIYEEHEHLLDMVEPLTVRKALSYSKKNNYVFRLYKYAYNLYWKH